MTIFDPRMRRVIELALDDVRYAQQELNKPNSSAFGVVASQSPLDSTTRSALKLAEWAMEFAAAPKQSAPGEPHRSRQDALVALKRQMELTKEALGG
jgi:hypothetical protein